jgi:outer membrane protein assembly factor BamB
VYAALGGSGGRAAAFNDSGTVLWTITTDGDTQAVAYMNGVLYVGGHFDNACVSPLVASIGGTCLDGSISRIKFLAVDGTTGALLSWAPQGNGVHGVLHWAVSPSLGKLAAGGQFTTVGGIYHKRFAQFSS